MTFTCYEKLRYCTSQTAMLQSLCPMWSLVSISAIEWPSNFTRNFSVILTADFLVTHDYDDATSYKDFNGGPICCCISSLSDINHSLCNLMIKMKTKIT